MNAQDLILGRRSVRVYAAGEIPAAAIQRLLEAAMAAPSAMGRDPWRFVVIDDRKLLDRVPAVNPYAEMARQAPLAILICADPSLERSPGYWMLDCAAAAQNMLLAAHALGLGAVWLGEILKSAAEVNRLLELPDRYELMAVVAVGRPARSNQRSTRKKLEELVLAEF